MTAPADGTGILHDAAMTDVVAATLDDAPHDPHQSATAARRSGTGWAVETTEGWVPVAQPRRREPAGDAPRMGEHTTEVLRGLGIPTA
ncbi:hypothetical protein AB0D57_42820 [Streptomyces sp. NPDC048275]|uniref:hypothetical protein n=1 Tax=Streptomyces sp. NPDC048275 TaxID=3155629 RepID=UPI0033ED48C5